MGSNFKAADQIVSEGRSHRTKAEIEARKAAEAAALSGIPMREWESVRSSPIANEMWERVLSTMNGAGKNDAIYEAPCNRYCLIHAELPTFYEELDHFNKLIRDAWTQYDNGEIDIESYAALQAKLEKLRNDVDGKIAQKRKMMLDIERENAMTINGALKAIPKKPVSAEDTDPMALMMKQRMEMRG